MAAGTWNFTIEQGSTFTRTLLYKDANNTPVPLAGLTARMQLRGKLADPTVLLSLTTENGRITLTDPGEIRLDLDSEVTAGLTFKTAAYDLELVDASATPEIVNRLLQGNITLSPEVTRP